MPPVFNFSVLQEFDKGTSLHVLRFIDSDKLQQGRSKFEICNKIVVH